MKPWAWLDLAAYGLDVIQLRVLLRGADVLVDESDLYERWPSPEVSHERISSHDLEVDKREYPDYGMRGPLVREKLHGRTATAPGFSWRRRRRR